MVTKQGTEHLENRMGVTPILKTTYYWLELDEPAVSKIMLEKTCVWLTPGPNRSPEVVANMCTSI